MNNIIGVDNAVQYMNNACDKARELPKEVATIDDAQGEIAMYLIRDAMMLLNFVDKFGFKLNEYMSIINEM